MEKVIIEGRRITAPLEIGGDGLSLCGGREFIVRDCIIDFSGCDIDKVDECVGVTWGSSAHFVRCVIRGAGKLVLCGCGDDDKVQLEKGKRVSFFDCLFEDFGRRGPEVQDGMRADLHNCVIRNWGCPSRYSVRNFGAWAHRKGRIDAYGCVFWQDSFWRPWKQFWGDLANHIGEAWNTEGVRGLLRPSTWMPGVCKGLLATDGGEAYAWSCYRNHWWIALPWGRTTQMMDAVDAKILIAQIERMAEELDARLPR